MRAVPKPNRPPTLYPETAPARSGRLAVSGGHELHWAEWGVADGVPVLVLHGGPGSGMGTLLARFFDPQRFRIVGFDQRGAGRSSPAGATHANCTERLLADIRSLRNHLSLPRSLVFGGSWGATLALLHAADAPDGVAGLLLRGVFLARREDVEQFFDASAHGVDDDPWAVWRGNASLVERLDQVLNHDGAPAAAADLARTWWTWEQRLDGVDAAPADEAQLPALLQRYRVQAHYLRHDCWLAQRPLLDRLSRVPRVPTLLLHGTLDRICPPAGAEAVQRTLPGSALRWIEAAGHAPTHPAMSAAIVAAVDAWADQRHFGDGAVE